MSIQISRETSAAYPDRPADRSGHGLLVHVSDDQQAQNAGQSVGLHLTAAMNRWHLRVLLNPATLQNGAITWLAGYDAADNFLFRGEYDAITRQVTFRLASGQTLSVTLPSQGPQWHQVQWMLDAASGTMQLWHQGVSVASGTGTYSGMALSKLRLGGWDASSGASGDLHLDEWAIGDAYLLPPKSPSSESGTDHPTRRWLVIYNRADADSLAWAEFYRQQWNIPHAHLCGLNLPQAELIDATAFVAMRSAVVDYLANNGLADSILGLLLGYRVPGYALDTLETHSPIVTLFHALDHSWPVDNTLSRAWPIIRPSRENLGTVYMTARIDAPSLDEAKAITQRAKALKAADWNDPSSNRLWFDPYWIDHPMARSLKAQAIGWAQGVDRQRTLLPLEMPPNSDPTQDADFAAIHHDGFVFTWNSGDPPSGFFAQPAGRRALCVQLAVNRAVVSSRRSSSGTDWSSAAFQAGYAAVAATSRSLSPTGWVVFRPLFEALRQGWTLGEAWHVASPLLSEEIELVGDPLMTLGWPIDGWRIDGPLEPKQPTSDATLIAILPIDRTWFTLPADRRPATNENRLYQITRLHDGQSVAGPLIHLTRTDQDQAAVACWPPLWPDVDAWPVPTGHQTIGPSIGWEGPLDGMGLKSIELWQRIGSNEPTLIQAWATTSMKPASWLQAELPMPETWSGQARQYAWRYQDQTGGWKWTCWSAPVGPLADTLPMDLPLLEDQP